MQHSATPPTPIVRAELEAWLETADSRLGDVYRGLKAGQLAEEIASSLGVSTANFVWNAQRQLDALLDGDLPVTPSVQLQVSRRLRTVLKDEGLSVDARAYITGLLAAMETDAADERLLAREDETAIEATKAAERNDAAGIYVYSLPHYMRHPYEPKSGRTLMKVGRSTSDVILRFRNQTRTTALPEEPILLRIYRSADESLDKIEATFHRLLESADHYRTTGRSAGREWFTTSTRFLDQIASTLGMEIDIVNTGTDDLD